MSEVKFWREKKAIFFVSNVEKYIRIRTQINFMTTLTKRTKRFESTPINVDTTYDRQGIRRKVKEIFLYAMKGNELFSQNKVKNMPVNAWF